VRQLRAAGGPVDASVAVPGSKSIANRALVTAALARGDSALVNVPDGDDTVAMLRCLAGLGVDVGVDVAVDGGGDAGAVSVVGTGGRLQPRAERLDAGLAGTTSRFVTALAALADRPVVVDGDQPLRARPMAQLHEALAALGATVEPGATTGRLPVTITGPLRRGGTVAMRGDVSSQFVTALMLIGPLLDGGLRIELTSPLVSLPYVRLTAAVMQAFGVTGVEVSEMVVAIPAGRYSGTSFDVEPDASAASYPLAVAAVCGGRVTVPGLTIASTQGDIAVLDLLAAMGCDVGSDGRSVSVARPLQRSLRGIDVDMSATSDLVPTIAAVAATASTPTTIRGVGFIRAKESDRLGDLAAELARTGADVTTTEDGLHIEPVGGASGLHGAVLGTHHDHRLAMSFAVLGTAVDGIGVADPGVVSKSWPGFWEAFDSLVGSARDREGQGTR
jgi:3-phosphoshikimate 1-carboxyvinyltransferase